MTDDRFDRLLREVAQDYHRPPTPPREEMWRAIVATRAARRQRRGVWHTTLRWGVGIAAVLALGIARLMLDSPAAADVRLRALLEDLELVLAQIAQLPAQGDREGVQVITHQLEQRSVLLRLRSAASPAPERAQGAL